MHFSVGNSNQINDNGGTEGKAFGLYNHAYCLHLATYFSTMAFKMTRWINHFVFVAFSIL